MVKENATAPNIWSYQNGTLILGIIHLLTRNSNPPTLGGVLDGFSKGEGENPLPLQTERGGRPPTPRHLPPLRLPPTKKLFRTTKFLEAPAPSPGPQAPEPSPSPVLGFRAPGHPKLFCAQSSADLGGVLVKPSSIPLQPTATTSPAWPLWWPGPQPRLVAPIDFLCAVLAA